MSLNILWSSIIIIGMALSAFLGFVTFKIRNADKRANTLIGLFALATLLFLFRGFIINTRLYIHIPEITMFLDCIKYLLGPIILFYTYFAIIDPKRKYKFGDTIHFVPLVIKLSLTLFIMSTYPGNLRDYIINWLNSAPFQPGVVLDSILRLSFNICFWGYILYSQRLLGLYKRSSGTMKKIDPFYLAFISYLIPILICSLIIWLVLIVFMKFGLTYSHVYVHLFVIVSVSVIILAYCLLTQSRFLFHAKQIKQSEKHFISDVSRTHENFNLKIILELMENEELYLNPELDLYLLSKKTGLTRNHVSHIVNKMIGKTFTEFINSYRVQKAKEYLKNSANKKINILNIAFKSGFNSKSTFNKAFKELVGTSPSLYRKKKILDVTKLEGRYIN